eukprot:COSAG05_NODE_18572_length_306_cov_0.985507_1_plen_75_part_00
MHRLNCPRDLARGGKGEHIDKFVWAVLNITGGAYSNGTVQLVLPLEDPEDTSAGTRSNVFHTTYFLVTFARSEN